MPKLNRGLVLAVILAGVAMPALAAPHAGFQIAARDDTATPDPAAPMRLADNDDDDDDGWRRKGDRRDRHDGERRGRHHDDDDDDDEGEDDDDDRAAPRRVGPAPAQNPLIGAHRANTN